MFTVVNKWDNGVIAFIPCILFRFICYGLLYISGRVGR